MMVEADCMISADTAVGFDALDPAVEGSCLLCGSPTAVKSRWKNTAAGERWDCLFDPCDACKLVPSCFTCLYGNPWYLRYNGRCDVNTALLFGGDRQSRSSARTR